MKRFIFMMVVMALLILPCYAQTDADKEVARAQEFTATFTKHGAEKISALKAYIQKFPETSSKWTVLAYYNLAVEYFNTKDYPQAIQTGEKTLKMQLGEGETGRLLLVVANSYGVKNTPSFNQDKAQDYAQKAISFAESKGLNDVLEEAKNLKSKLSGPPPKTMTPEQQLKFNFSNSDYAGVIAQYQKLSAAEKADEELRKLYANSLLKSNKSDQALSEYQALLSKFKKASYALKIAEVYDEKAKKNKQFIDNAVDAYLEAHLLFLKENNSSNAKTALDTAKYRLYEKYDLNERIKKVNAAMKTQEDPAKKNAAAIANLEKEIRKEERRIRKEYESQDIEPPAYEKQKIEKLRKQITALQSGAPASGAPSKSQEEAKKLEDDLNKVKKEVDDLLAKAKKRLGM
ncbi:MAG: tetratricopeptide repeat protein [Candidatus Omnitrophota bacterium]